MHRTYSRRRFSGLVGAAGLSGLLGSRLQAASRKPSQATASPYRRCITLWMQGGPSQFETFDPKPGTETGGPLSVASTSVPGMQFSETLSGLANHASDFCVIRNIGSNQGEHERATHLLHTGFEEIASFPRPALGSFVSHGGPESTVPGFVTLGSQVHGPAFLGAENGPFVIGEIEQAKMTIDKVAKISSRLDLVDLINRRYSPFEALGDLSAHGPLQSRTKQIESVKRLVGSPFATALDLEKEGESTLGRYGKSPFGRRVLAARRMLEAGVRYVEVQMPGWDTHVGNFNSVKQLCLQLEPAWCALMEDLKSNGLWEDTLILWMGEFGRTPGINGGNGRDHYPQNIPVALAGHSFGGRVVGSTGKDGRDHREDPRSVSDLMFTLMSLLGIDATAELTTEFDSPTTATDGGRPIDEVLA
ncbi:MAG: DUF1501 domain-containing protein [Planctomycetota bacterium]